MKILQSKKIHRSIKVPHVVQSVGCCGNQAGAEKPPCCGPRLAISGGEITDNVPGFQSWLDTPAGKVPLISSSLAFSDKSGAFMARWGIGRMHYIVPSGLYAIGAPDFDAPVVVTANYKMSYDIVRSVLSGRDVWLLVLETFGVNVWCAAGKGTFGTDELVRRIKKSGLPSVVTHRQLILPVLGAPGVCASEVTRRSGFSVSYATIRANDLPEFLDNGMVTTAIMRKISFSAWERLVLVPVELVNSLKPVALVGGAAFLVTLLVKDFSAAVLMFVAYLGAVLAGVAVVPILLPWIPGRSFALKGVLAGIVWSAWLFRYAGGGNWGMITTAAAFLALPAVCAFHSLNFTGCTTYTSRTGVKKEMRLAIPLMGIAITVSIILLVVGIFL